MTKNKSKCDHEWIYAVPTIRKCSLCWVEELKPELGRWTVIKQAKHPVTPR